MSREGLPSRLRIIEKSRLCWGSFPRSRTPLQGGKGSGHGILLPRRGAGGGALDGVVAKREEDPSPQEVPAQGCLTS